jgi:hypothetical protein
MKTLKSLVKGFVSDAIWVTFVAVAAFLVYLLADLIVWMGEDIISALISLACGAGAGLVVLTGFRLLALSMRRADSDDDA